MKTLFKSKINTRLLRFLLNQHKTLIFVYSILFFASFPLSVITQILRPSFSKIMTAENPELIPYLLVIFAVPVFIIAPFILFNYAFSKRAVSTFHAMPVKRRDLFITLTIVSLISVAIPFILTYSLGYAIAYLGTNVVYNVEHLFNLCRALVLLTALMGIAILVITNTGALSEAIIYTGIALIIPFVATMAYDFFADRFLLGYVNITEQFLYYLTPFVSLFRIFSNNIWMGSNFNKDLVTSYWFIGSIALLAISITIFDKRKSERTELPFTNNLFFPIVASCFTVFLLISLISFFAPYNGSLFEPASFIMPIMISFIIFIILNIIKDRSTKRIMLAFKNFVIIVVVAFTFAASTVLTGGFGFVNRVPDVSKVEKVLISNSAGIVLPYSGGSSNTFQVEDPEAIEIIIDLHKTILQENTRYKDRYTSSGYDRRHFPFEFEYVLTNGNKMARIYYVTEETLKKLSGDLSSYLQTKALIADLKDSEQIKSFIVTSPFMDTTYSFDGNFKTLVETYYNEMANLTVSEFQSEGGKLVYNVLVATYNNYQISTLSIDERFSETLAYLESNLKGSKIDNRANLVTERITLEKDSDDQEDSCFYSPFRGVITTDSYFYTCTNYAIGMTETEITNLDAYPYSFGNDEFEVVQAILYLSDYPVALMIPVKAK